MKVFTDYSDGVYSMRPAETENRWMSPERWAWYQARLVEISDETWARYEEFLKQAKAWNDEILKLDVQAHEQSREAEADISNADTEST